MNAIKFKFIIGHASDNKFAGPPADSNLTSSIENTTDIPPVACASAALVSVTNARGLNANPTTQQVWNAPADTLSQSNFDNAMRYRVLKRWDYDFYKDFASGKVRTCVDEYYVLPDRFQKMMYQSGAVNPNPMTIGHIDEGAFILYFLSPPIQGNRKGMEMTGTARLYFTE